MNRFAWRQRFISTTENYLIKKTIKENVLAALNSFCSHYTNIQIMVVLWFAIVLINIQ